MKIAITDTDTLLSKGAAITLHQPLQSPLAEAEGQRVYPPTFIDEEAYFIDSLAGGETRCILDTKQSQARRLAKKLIFINEARPESERFLPDVTVSGAGSTKRIGEIGHRVSDAAVLLADGVNEHAVDAIKAYNKGDAGRLATYFPESLLFGFWDSHSLGERAATNAKRSRILHSEIHAYGAALVHSKSMYIAAAPELVGEEQYNEDKGDEKLSQAGLANAPGKLSRDGIVAQRIARSAEINLATLRQLTCKNEDGSVNAAKTSAMQSYLLHLAVLALTDPDTDELNLRSGALLVQQAGATSIQALLRDGTKVDLEIPKNLLVAVLKAAKAWFAASTGSEAVPSLSGNISPKAVSDVRKNLSAKSKKPKGAKASTESAESSEE